MVCVLQAPPAAQTPAWGGLAKNGKSSEPGADKDAAAPKTWRGHGEWQVALPCLHTPVMTFNCWLLVRQPLSGTVVVNCTGSTALCICSSAHWHVRHVHVNDAIQPAAAVTSGMEGMPSNHLSSFCQASRTMVMDSTALVSIQAVLTSFTLYAVSGKHTCSLCAMCS